MIKATNLQKTFGGVTAVDGVSLSLDRGVAGFLGPNGAGKSTTMRMLAGYLVADAGQASIGGHDIVSDRQAAQALIGYLPEAAGGFANLTVREFLIYCGECRSLWGPALTQAIDSASEMVDVTSALDRKMMALSKGWRQRAWFAQALLHDPPVLIMDEPTDGLDPNQKDHMRTLIRSLAPTKTILLSTHILEEAEEICDRAIIIANGKIVADDVPAALVDERGRLATAFRRLTGTHGSGDISRPEASVPKAGHP